MAQLDVQRKRSNPWWIWLLLALIALAILFFAARGCNGGNDAVTAADSTGTTAVAATEPEWNSVDFNLARSTDPDISDTDIAVSSNDRYTIYSLGENILFASGQNQLQAGAEDKLKQIVNVLNKRFKGASIGVYGNTDSEGSASSNKTLGAERAAAVKDWLTGAGGMNASAVSVHSFGESKPVASNATESGRQQNRNVSIVAFTK